MELSTQEGNNHHFCHDNKTSGVYIHRLTSLLAVERSIDTVVWQLLASVIIPGLFPLTLSLAEVKQQLTSDTGYTIHTVVAFVHYLLQNGLHIDAPNVSSIQHKNCLKIISYLSYR